MMFVRRLCTTPKSAGICSDFIICPDIWELDNGDFAVIGRDITQEAKGVLPADVGVGPEERVVVLPRALLISARANIPQAS